MLRCRWRSARCRKPRAIGNWHKLPTRRRSPSSRKILWRLTIWRTSCSSMAAARISRLTLHKPRAAGCPIRQIPRITWAWAYYQNGAYSVAAPLFEEAVKKMSDNVDYRYHLGLTYQKLHDNDRARAQFEKIIGLNPKSTAADQARRALGQISGG